MRQVSGSRKVKARLCSAAALGALLLATSPASAGDINYTYDELGRLTQVSYPNGKVVTYSYDAAGNRTQLSSNAPNQPPAATNDTLTTNQGVAKSLDSRTNDSDPDGDPLTITAVGGTHSKGSVSFTSTSVTYTPTAGAYGSDSFTYTVSDGQGGTDVGTVSVTINRLPTATGDSISTAQDTAITFDPRTNDSDPDGNALTVSAIVTSPTHGTASKTSTSITYTPATGYTGSDSFTYRISDGVGGTATATVTVTITAAANQAPVAANDTLTTNQGVAKTIDPRANDTDANSDPLSVTAVGGTPSKGSVSYTGTSVTYTPTAGQYGADSFTYTVSDGHGGTDVGTVSVTINRPPTAAGDSISTTQSTAITFDPRANDSDLDGDALTVSTVGTASHGTTSRTTSSITYTPTSGYTGSDSFTYTLSDGKGGTATATVSVTVTSSVANGTVLFTSSTSGSFSYTIPAGVAFVDIEGWGGGANGSLFSGLNVGGGGGGYFKKHIAVTQGQVIAGNIAAGGGTAATTVTSPALSATTPLPLNGQSGGQGGLGGTATGGDINTSGNTCCQVHIYDGGSAGNGGGDQTTANASGTAPGGGGAGGTGLGANGRVTITARTS